MEMTGVVIAILPERSGTSQRGEWKSQSFVIETQEQYPKHLCFEVFGADRIAQFNIKGGETITVQFDIDARQYQDRWFNSINYRETPIFTLFNIVGLYYKLNYCNYLIINHLHCILIPYFV